MTTRKKWADEDVDVDEDTSVAGGAFESAPDAHGVITRVSYYKNAKGQTMKVERKVKIHRKITRINKAVYARRSLAPFGEDNLAGPDAFSVVRATDDYPIEVPKKAGTLEKENDDDYYFQDLPAKPINLRNKFKQVKDADEPTEVVEGDQEETLRKRQDDDDTGPKKYIPPSMRVGAIERTRQTEQQQKDECTVRVTNLSEDVKEGDLNELFGSVGKVYRVYLAKHKETKNSKGFAFITYHYKKDAEAAIKQLNRHGYDNLLLNVEWAKPSNRDKERDRP